MNIFTNCWQHFASFCVPIKKAFHTFHVGSLFPRHFVDFPTHVPCPMSHVPKHMSPVTCPMHVSCMSHACPMSGMAYPMVLCPPSLVILQKYTSSAFLRILTHSYVFFPKVQLNGSQSKMHIFTNCLQHFALNLVTFSRVLHCFYIK